MALSDSKGQSALEESLVGYYPLDGHAKDQSGNCNHGVIHGAVSSPGIAGKTSSALTFDGLNDYVEIPHSALLDFDEESDFAVSFWVKLAENQADLDTTDNDILSKWVIDDASMSHMASGYPFTFRVINQKSNKRGRMIAAQFGGYKEGCHDGTNLGADVVPGRYQHILFNSRAGKFYLYVDGKLVKRAGSSVFCVASNQAPLRIGKRGGSEFQNHFKGSVDELALFNAALSKEDIAILADPGFKPSRDVDLIAESSELIQSDTLFFDDNIFELKGAQKIDLSFFYKHLESGAQYHLVIEGHSNGLPDHDFCDALSLKRAQVVEDYLLGLGIACTKITTRGLGKRHQISPNSTPVLRKRNQRAEVKLYRISRA